MSAVYTKAAVAAKILELCKAYDITINPLDNSAVVSPSSIYSTLNVKSQNPDVVSIKLSAGLDISLRSLTIQFSTIWRRRSSKRSIKTFIEHTF